MAPGQRVCNRTGVCKPSRPCSCHLLTTLAFALRPAHISHAVVRIYLDNQLLHVAEGTTILDAARLGQYSQERLVELPQHYLQRYFTETSGQFTLIPSIRDMVHFRHGNIFHGDIYQPCDLVLCRNVLIYFAREQQENVICNIARALNRWGIMVLGKSETLLGASRNYFEAVCPVERIYRLAEPGRVIPASRVALDDGY